MKYYHICCNCHNHIRNVWCKAITKRLCLILYLYYPDTIAIANSSTAATAAMATGAAQEQLVWDADGVVELCECVSCVLDRCVCARD